MIERQTIACDQHNESIPAWFLSYGSFDASLVSIFSSILPGVLSFSFLRDSSAAHCRALMTCGTGAGALAVHQQWRCGRMQLHEQSCKEQCGCTGPQHAGSKAGFIPIQRSFLDPSLWIIQTGFSYGRLSMTPSPPGAMEGPSLPVASLSS